MIKDMLNALNIKDVIVSERMKVYEASFGFNVNEAIEYKFFRKIVDSVSSRDKITIRLQDENDRIFGFSDEEGKEKQYNDFISNTLQDENIKVGIRIDKAVDADCLSIYSFDEFVNDILSLSVEDVMKGFSDLLKQSSGRIIFEAFENINIFTTKTMFFVQNGREKVISEFDRMGRLEECKKVSYFYNLDTYELIPDDFKIVVDYKNNRLTELFRKIENLLSISFIASSASLTGSTLKGVINGQRTMEYSCDISELNKNKWLYSIYNWVYTEGNAVDKIIIARNVISLHCKYVSVAALDEKVMASIQSNYNLYLKDNVKEYLELKNKMAEFICDIVSKSGEYATFLLDKFKTNIIAIFGFLFTVIMANIVSSQPLENIFTRDITILVECILIGSFIYLAICFLQSQYEIKKVQDSYDQLKDNYKEILTEDDIKEVFQNDSLFNKMNKSVKISRCIYLALWIIFLLVAICVVEILSVCPTSLQIANGVKTILISLKAN